MSNKNYASQSEAARYDEALMRTRCARLGKPFPESADSYTPGKRASPTSYQRNYALPRQPGIDGSGSWHLVIDGFMTANQGVPVVNGDGTTVQLDFGAGLLGEKFGMNCSLSAADVDTCKALGVRWIRIGGGIGWGNFHSTEAAFNADRAAGGIWPPLQTFASQVAYAHSQGIRVLAIALSSPRWAHGADRTDGGYVWHQAILPNKRPQFAEYVHQLALCGADAVELINEPNHTVAHGYWLGPDHPRINFPVERVDDFVLLLQTVYTRLKSDPATAVCQLGLGGIANFGHELLPSPLAIHGTTWYQRLFAATADDRVTPIGAAGYFDFACVHPYAELNTASGPTEWDFRWAQFPNQYGDAAYAHGMASVTRVRAALVAGGCANAKVWATEVGAPTAGGAGSVTEAKQDTWTSQYVTAWASTGATTYTAPLATNYYGAFTGPMFFYQLRDQSDGVIAPTDKEGFFGLLRYDGSAKPSRATVLSLAQGVAP